jgi:hypothetical protein
MASTFAWFALVMVSIVGLPSRCSKRCQVARRITSGWAVWPSNRAPAYSGRSSGDIGNSSVACTTTWSNTALKRSSLLPK